MIQIEEERYKLIALKLIYHGFQLMLVVLIVLNVILGFHLIQLINKRKNLIKINESSSFKNNRNERSLQIFETKKQIKIKNMQIKNLIITIWKTFMLRSVHFNSLMSRFVLAK